MSLTLDHVELRVMPPRTPRHLPVFSLGAVSMHEREPAVKTLSERFKLGRTTQVEAPYGSVFASERGTLQFFAASGGLLVRSCVADNALACEQRPWKRLERDSSAAPTLSHAMVDHLVTDTLVTLTNARLRPTECGPLKALAPTFSLDAGRAAVGGSATVLIGYAIDGIPLLGPGAKTHGRFEPDDGGAELVELFHAPRRLGQAQRTALAPAEAALDRLAQNDRELQHFHARGQRVRFDTMVFGFYALPVFEPQAVLLPVLQVQGSTSDPERPEHETRFGRVVSLLATEGVTRHWTAPGTAHGRVGRHEACDNAP